MPTRFVAMQSNQGRLRVSLAIVSLLLVAGLLAAHHMEGAGHHVTGMSNQIVWGVPHVFAVFLIVAASGALNVASLASVFSRQAYKPFTRISVLVAVALLIGGLSVLVLDLGRPDRLVVAMTHYNFKSVFAWNIFLYTGFVAVALVYLWTLMEGRLNRHSRATGTVAFVWRLVLTTGTGCIFGFLVARPGFNAAIMAPLFISMSFAFGLAVFILITFAVLAHTNAMPDASFVRRLGRLLGAFIWAVLFLVTVHHVTNLYAAEHREIERFLLADGGIYPVAFWFGQIGLGTLAPLGVLRWSRNSERPGGLYAAALLVVVGGFAQLYVLIIGMQAFPLRLFTNKVVIESSFFDGVVASYSPSLPEFALGLGGVGIALAVVCIGLTALRVLPDPSIRLDTGPAERGRAMGRGAVAG